ncbi:MAG: hypothetical protein AB8G23_06390 [Myxococcota bacterium]
MAAPSDLITVVSGIPRSGTSLAMQMVAATGIEPLVDDARPPDASNPRGYFELDAVKRMPRLGTDWLTQARGRSVKVIHALLEFLPRDVSYRVVYMERDLDEVIASQDRMLERQGEATGAEGGLPKARLREILEKQNAAAIALLESERCFELECFTHRTLMIDPARSAERMAAFLGCEDAAPAIAAHVDPALYRERTESAGS